MEFDPFLFLDEAIIDDPKKAGFPDHPHRGFETVTYLITGKVTHEDFRGHKRMLKTGDVQWYKVNTNHLENKNIIENIN